MERTGSYRVQEDKRAQGSITADSGANRLPVGCRSDLGCLLPSTACKLDNRLGHIAARLWNRPDEVDLRDDVPRSPGVRPDTGLR